MEQVKALVRACAEGDGMAFRTVTLRIAAAEAAAGHAGNARELKELACRMDVPVEMQETSPLVSCSMPGTRLDEATLPAAVTDTLERILSEYRNRQKLRSLGLAVRRRILITGPQGTGRTMTAEAIAGELGLPLFTVHLDECSDCASVSLLRRLTGRITSMPGVWLFDADGITDRYDGMACSALRHILRSCRTCDGIIVVEAREGRDWKDCFDEAMHYALPDREDAERLFRSRLPASVCGGRDMETMLLAADGLSQAAISGACDDAVKDSVISGEGITAQDVMALLWERKKHPASGNGDGKDDVFLPS